LPRRLPEETRQEILAAIRAANGTRSTRDLAAQFGVSASLVGKLAREAGVSGAFDRSVTQAATTARVADQKARRAVINNWLLDDIDRLRDRAWKPYTQVLVGPTGPEFVTTKLPGLGDQRNAYVMIAMLLDKHVMLSRFDLGDADAPVKGLLGTLLDGLRAEHGVDPDQAGA
jgi:transposase-like protein